MFLHILLTATNLNSPLEQFEICSYSTNPSITTNYYLDLLQNAYFTQLIPHGYLIDIVSIYDWLIVFFLVKVILNFYNEIKTSQIFFLFFFTLACLTSVYIFSETNHLTVAQAIFNSEAVSGNLSTNNLFKIVTSEISMIYFFSVFFCFIFIYVIIYLLFKNSLSNNYNKLIPNIYQMLSEVVYKASLNLFTSTLGKHVPNQEFFIKIYTIFLFLIISNVQGMIPYMSTLTSALTNTFFMALALFISIIITILDKKGIKYFLNLFMPPGCPIALIFLLIPIEVISYSFRVVSLSVRLFANMMAGHTLLKVIVGFSWVMIFLGDFMVIANLLPLVTLFILTLLEFGVALIQAYIFTILSCIYLRDIFEGH